ncbi:hypothetical protein [Maritimibacter dapengensis]|uniref:Uncharacterized protein n=1 Tax=Maritimibacter dapengensis TaxID=2836868 RepID=A0ABS6T1T5_9RHOB|nr:hypothetical protein [Maritimibacter dapengensis]MBV7379182.1 hypothetical protein [Maritimibacter dapengensis]
MDREQALVEPAAPVLTRLTNEIEWPSVLAVPRPTHTEALEAEPHMALVGCNRVSNVEMLEVAVTSL